MSMSFIVVAAYRQKIMLVRPPRVLLSTCRHRWLLSFDTGPQAGLMEGDSLPVTFPPQSPAYAADSADDPCFPIHFLDWFRTVLLSVGVAGSFGSLMAGSSPVRRLV